MVLVRTTMAVVAFSAARMASRSMVPSLSPALTASPTRTVRLKGLPSSSTVSTPRWTRTSRPESALNPMACPVPATMVTSASTGETMTPSSGSTPRPSPTALEEKTGSGTSARSMTFPVTGEAIGTSRSVAGWDMRGSFRSVVLAAGSRRIRASGGRYSEADKRRLSGGGCCQEWSWIRPVGRQKIWRGDRRLAAERVAGPIDRAQTSRASVS